MSLREGFWAAHRTLVLDGGLATELERRGRDLSGGLWSARVLGEDPDAIVALHYDYFAAGADIGISASYQASFPGLEARGWDRDRAADLFARSVALVGEARDRFWSGAGQTPSSPARRRPLVAASVGCYGAYLADGSEYRGDYGLSRAELAAFHRPRLAALAAAGPDLIACETIPCLVEAEALVEVLRDFPELPAWVSFSAADGARVCHGEPFAECAGVVAEAPSVVAVGINCTAPAHVSALLRSARDAVDMPFVVYPNRGEAWDAAAQRWSGAAAGDDPLARAVQWHELGARIIGGCCRTTPDDIRRLRQSLADAGCL